MIYNPNDNPDVHYFIQKLKSLGGNNPLINSVLSDINFVEGLKIYSDGKGPVSSLYRLILEDQNLDEKDKGYRIFAWVLKHISETGKTDLTNFLSAAGDLGMLEGIDSETRGEMISYSIQIAQEKEPKT